MKVDSAQLRERFQSRSVDELTQVVVNASGSYTEEAIQVARRELMCRPASETSGPVATAGPGAYAEREKSLREILPVGLWFVFCLARGVVPLVVVVAVAATGVMLHLGVPVQLLVLPLLSWGIVCAIAWWIAAGIRAERLYVRPLLLSLISGATFYEIAMSVLDRQFTRNDLALTGLLAVAFWYFAFSDDVRQYYGGRRVTELRSGDKAAAI